MAHKKIKKETKPFTVQINDFTYDRLYRKGETIHLSHEKTINELINLKIIK